MSFVSVSAQAPAPERTPVLAELFTSEGCNSCPPADRILEWLSKEQPVDGVYVVTLSEHVTYWDHQGWKDPFGSTRLTERQDAYGARLKLASVYTPQLIIDGTTELVGSDAAALKRVLTQAAKTAKPRLSIAASVANGAVTASASGPGLDASATDGSELLWAVTEDDLVVDVKRGENANRTLHHSGVVRAFVTTKIEPGHTTITSPAIQLAPDWKRDHLHVVAFVQSPKTKRVISVGSASLAGHTP